MTCNYYISTNATFICPCVWYNLTKLCHTCPALTDINQGNCLITTEMRVGHTCGEYHITQALLHARLSWTNLYCTHGQCTIHTVHSITTVLSNCAILHENEWLYLRIIDVAPSINFWLGNPIICDVYLVYFMSINNNVISMH